MISFFNQENNDLANRKSQSKKEQGEYQKMRYHSAIRDFLGHGIKAAVKIEDGLHDDKNNI